MTIAVAIKVRDGIVLAADSATTLASGAGVANVYDHANKIVNLCKGKPIGFMTWGLGGFGSANIAMLAKDFREEVWPDKFNGSYTVEGVASELKDFLMPIGAATLPDVPEGQRGFGFLVAGDAPGHTAGDAWGHVWKVEVDAITGDWSEPEEVLPGEDGIIWYGQPQWLQRLILGVDFDAAAVALVDRLGLDANLLPVILGAIRDEAQAAFHHPAMPIQDVINLGGFLVEVTKGAVMFAPGAPTVGGPTEIAAITKHEGFKWVSRKHYFDRILNPEG